jgi:hypothetical protein
MSMRPTKFSPLVLAQITLLVDRGLSPKDIAEKIGCKLGTLRVRCSQHGISLRRNRKADVAKRREARAQLVILLTQNAIDSLQRMAKRKGTSRARFVALLLETIARDDLYDAVLDGE